MQNDKYSLENSNKAFEELIEEQSCLPQWFKTGIENALMGKPFFSSEQLLKLTREEFRTSDYLSNPEKMKEFDLNLSKKDWENLDAAAWLSQEIICSTIKNHYGWGVPTEDTVSAIIEYLEYSNLPGILEVGAGSGLWSGVISSRTDKDVVACELNLRQDTPKPKFYPVLNENALALIESHPHHAVLIVWADTNDFPLEVARNLAPETTLIIAGPISVTANEKFYKYLDQNFDIQNSFRAASFSGSDDFAFILKKCREPKEECIPFFLDKYIKDNPHYAMKMKIAKPF